MFTDKLFRWSGTVLLAMLWAGSAVASSHREAPLIANDPLADNTDLYAFRSPDNPNTITIIANYIPAQLPHGGPNYHTFGENIRYEIHIDTAVEKMKENPSEVVVPLTAGGTDKVAAGRGYVKSFRYTL